jgi:outer membrane receptor protein involved in Fe transport
MVSPTLGSSSSEPANAPTTFRNESTVKLVNPGNDNGPTVNLYGAYSQSFLPPRCPSSLVPADVPLNLKPEDISNYEAGVKAALASAA